MLPGGGQLARCIHRWCLTLLIDDDGFLCHLRPYVVEEFAEGGIALGFLQLLEQEIGEESVALLPVRIGRLVALCRTYHQHVSLGSLSLRLDGHASGRSQHAFAALGSAEAGIHHHRHILGAQGMELVIELTDAVARGQDTALAVYGQQIGSAVAFVRHAMSGIIEDKPSLVAIGLGDVLHPADFCQDIVERGILAHVHILLGDAQRLGAILAESHSVVEGELHIRWR